MPAMLLDGTAVPLALHFPLRAVPTPGPGDEDDDDDQESPIGDPPDDDWDEDDWEDDDDDDDDDEDEDPIQVSGPRVRRDGTRRGSRTE